MFKSRPAPRGASPEEAKDLLAHGYRVLDVREAWEFAAGHIAASTHIPLRQLPERFPDLIDGGSWVTVCRSGSRSGHATEYLASRGVAAVNLVRGLKQWERSGLPLVNDQGNSGRVA